MPIPSPPTTDNRPSVLSPVLDGWDAYRQAWAEWWGLCAEPFRYDHWNQITNLWSRLRFEIAHICESTYLDEALLMAGATFVWMLAHFYGWGLFHDWWGAAVGAGVVLYRLERERRGL